MATPNFVHIEKTIDDDGIIVVDFINDGIESGGEVYNAAIQVGLNGSDPTTPLNGIRLESDGEPLEFFSSSQAWMFTLRAADGQGFRVTHLDGDTDPVEQIRIPYINDDAVVAENHVFGIWRNGGPTRLNLYIPYDPATTPVEGSTSDPDRDTNSFADLEEMTKTFIPVSTYCDVEFECTMKLTPSGSGATSSGQVQLVVAGSAVTSSIRSFSCKSSSLLGLTPGESIQQVFIGRRVTGLTPGVSTTIKVQWKATSGTIVAVGTERTLRIW